MVQPGDILGRYRVDRLIGTGASAAVHLAQDVRSGAWVALKVFVGEAPPPAEPGGDARAGGIPSAASTSARSGVGSASSRALLASTSATPSDPASVGSKGALLREAMAAQRLSHPDLVAVFDAGETRLDGFACRWLAMELASGVTLERYTQPQRLLPPALAVHIVERVAGALAHAHAAGVVHRDIKPANILVDLPTGSVKLADLGTARLLDASHTHTGVLLGTPAYMAPEQLAGAPADAQGDLYSLGVVLFELLTGRRPHASASGAEFLRRVATVSAPDLRTLWPLAPEALAHAVAGLLATQPSQRTASAAQAAEALRCARGHIPSASVPA